MDEASQVSVLPIKSMNGAIAEGGETAVLKLVSSASEKSEEAIHVGLPVSALPAMLGLVLRLIEAANGSDEDEGRQPVIAPTSVATGTTPQGRRALVFELPMDCRITFDLDDALTETIAADFGNWSAGRMDRLSTRTEH